MCSILEPLADYYAEIVLHNNGFANYVEYISRESLKTMLTEAYKQGYKGASVLVCYKHKCVNRLPNDDVEPMTEKTAQVLIDESTRLNEILNQNHKDK